MDLIMKAGISRRRDADFHLKQIRSFTVCWLLSVRRTREMSRASVCTCILTYLTPSACIRPGCRSSSHILPQAGRWWWWPTGSWRPAERSLLNTARRWSEGHTEIIVRLTPCPQLQASTWYTGTFSKGLVCQAPRSDLSYCQRFVAPKKVCTLVCLARVTS